MFFKNFRGVFMGGEFRLNLKIKNPLGILGGFGVYSS
jgi:hypothetical protein